MSLSVELRLDGRRCVVVGGGRIGTPSGEAARRCRRGRDRRRPRGVRGAPGPGRRGSFVTPVPAFSARGRRRRSRRGRRDRLGPRSTQMVHHAAELAGALVNRADDAGSGDLLMPAVITAGALRVTVSSDGRAPAVTRWAAERLRGGIDGVLGLDSAQLAMLVEIVAEVRAELAGSGRHVCCRLAVGARPDHAGGDPSGPSSRCQGAPEGVSVVVVGANHRTAPLDAPRADGGVRRSAAQAAARARPGRAHLRGRHPVDLQPHRGVPRRRAVPRRLPGGARLLRRPHLPAARDFADSLYVHYDDDAVRHLFEVAAGLDSAVPGEHEILGQVRNAWEVARDEGTARRGLNLLFRHALEVGKRARTETRIAQHVTSVSQAAVIMAGERFGADLAEAATVAASWAAGDDRARHGVVPGPGRCRARSSWPTGPSPTAVEVVTACARRVVPDLAARADRPRRPGRSRRGVRRAAHGNGATERP